MAQDHKRVEVLSLAERAVKMPSRYGHSDVGDVLVSMLKGLYSANEAFEKIETLMQDYSK